MTLAAFDPRLIEQYEEPRYLIHFQWRDNTKVYRYALVDIIKQEDIEPTCKQKQDEIGLTQQEIWEKKYKWKIYLNHIHNNTVEKQAYYLNKLVRKIKKNLSIKRKNNGSC